MQFSPPKLSLVAFAFIVTQLAPAAVTPNGDSTFQGNRRPGLETATDEPTGENALLYRRLGKLRPDEFLEILSSTPSPN
jgi:hypothetical protein